MPDIAGIHHASLTVADLDTSVRWYGDVLGMEEVFREPGEQRHAVVLRFPGTEPVLGLVEHGGHGASPFDPTTIGLDHLAFTVGSRHGLEALAEQLTAQGVDHSGVTDIPPGAILNFKDPDGIALALFWDRPDPVADTA